MCSLCGGNKSVWNSRHVSVSDPFFGQAPDPVNDLANPAVAAAPGDPVAPPAAPPLPFGTIPQLADYLVNGYWAANGTISRHWVNFPITVDVTALNAADSAFAKQALKLWSDLCNITFTYVTKDANITYAAPAGSTQADCAPTINTSGPKAGEIIKQVVTIGDAYEGAPRNETFIHETGHALGLGHLGPYNGVWANSVFSNDTVQWSVMSYGRQDEGGNTGTNMSVDSPAMADIYAIQLMYGADPNTRSGGSIYGFNSNISDATYDFNLNMSPNFTIYDTGGNDWLDTSGYGTKDQTIDLNSGHWSSVGGFVTNIGIYLTTIIENAIGADGKDTMFGNEVGNILSGLKGNDVLFGGAGNDTLNGDDGADQLYGEGDNDRLNGGAGNDSLFGGDGNDRLNGGDGADILNGGNGKDQADYSTASAGVQASLFNGFGKVLNDVSVTDTYVSIEGLIGSSFDDQLVGDDTANGLYGNGGNDQLSGAGGNDVLDGGAGDDLLDGGAGTDSLTGGDGVDTAVYASETAGIVADLMDPSGIARVTTSTGRDSLYTVENITGSNFDDTIRGDNGVNVLAGGNGNDILEGRDGNDTLLGGYGNDRLDGGAGYDTASYADADAYVQASLQNGFGKVSNDSSYSDTYVSIEHLVGSRFGDQLAGNSGDNILDGQNGDDEIAGGNGDDWLYGAQGNDTLRGDAGSDLLYGGDGSDTASYTLDAAAVTVDLQALPTAGTAVTSTGTDTLFSIENILGSGFSDTLSGDGQANRIDGGAGNDVIDGRDGDDTLLGGQGNDTLKGGFGNDVLDGGQGTDQLFGEFGDDILSGVSGGDSLNGGSGNDAVSYQGAAGPVQVDLSAITDLYGNSFTSIESAIGSDFDDSLVGTAGANGLFGGAGKDTLKGGSGNDVLDGGLGNDSLDGGNDNDILRFSAGTDTADGGAGLDILSFENATTGLVLDLSVTTVSAATAGGAGTVTFTSIEGLIGTNFDDTITGDALDNVILGLDGHDAINAGEGNNIVYGGNGNDIVNTGDGNDIVDGGAGNDILQAGNGNNSVDGGDGDDSVEGGAGTDGLIGGNGNDLIWGYLGDDSLFGGAGNDALRGGFGNDILDGGDGDDILIGDDGVDQLNGGAGTDTATFFEESAGVSADLGANTSSTGDTFFSIENLTGSAFNDSLTGNSGGNIILGGAGADVLAGAAGNDTLDGGAGNDTVDAGTGNDIIQFSAGTDVINGGDGTDKLFFANVVSGVNASLSTGIVTGATADGAGTSTVSGIEDLTGSAFDDILTGNSGINILIGLGGNDSLKGNKGADILLGGAGNDTYYIDATDTISEETAPGVDDGGIDTVVADFSCTLQLRFENLRLVGTATQGTGNQFNNVITGNLTLGSLLDGGAGDDTVTGGSADDTLFGGAGNDILNGQGGNDTMEGGGGSDTFFVDSLLDTVIDSPGNFNEKDLVKASISYKIGAYIENLTLIGTSAINGTGNDVDNVITGNTAANILTGGLGNDTLLGGKGGDVLDGGSGNDFASYENSTGGVTVSMANPAINTGEATGDSYVSIEGLIGSAFNDKLTGDSLNNYLLGGAGNDTIDGGDGSDKIYGGLGNDSLTGGAGGDAFIFKLDGSKDTIKDFSNDQIFIDGVTFGITGSQDMHNWAVLGTTSLPAAPNADHGWFLVKNNAIYWDADGSGAGAAQQIAGFSQAVTIDYDNFFFVV